MSIWDAYKGDLFKFDAIGKSVAGVVVAVTIEKMPDGKDIPKLVLRGDDGTVTSILVSQKVLQTSLASHDPRPGDKVAICYVGDGTAMPGRSAAKLFDVAVLKADQSAPVAAAPAAPPQPVMSGAAALLGQTAAAPTINPADLA